jgi:hypothetical protein
MRFHVPGSKGPSAAAMTDSETRHLLAAVTQKEPTSDASHSDYASGRFAAAAAGMGSRDYASFYVREPLSSTQKNK